MPEPRGKRRRGTPRAGRRPDGYRRADPKPTQPIRTIAIANRLPSLPWLGVGAIVVIVLVGAFLVLRPGSVGSPVAGGSCPKSQPPALGAGQTRTVTLTTPKGTLVLKIEASLSPIAAGNFVALASCGFYDGTAFHRTATLQDGTPFVIQGGDPTGTGGGGPGYKIQDERVTVQYRRGTVAMARSAAANSVGSQFFIVLDDKAATILSSKNTYQIIGSVTSGMEVADAIYAASGGVELPSNPTHVTTATVANP
ncbi:MAG TPA: peptidylprolyl isomerase [Candidatus Limnocylindrales bacterium]|jgi:cyclophilin family peptidyl-prolyl cis-trans isomerase|nr:peptidylprolyl isomerase [Candidatus Limnocylindrales bacterium]